MTIAFVSNILNHHQMKLCEELKSRCDSFHFIATQEVSSLGYQKTIEASFVIHYYESSQREKAEKIIEDADVVIYGACDSDIVKKRIEKNKLTFWYAERLFKKGTWRRYIPLTKQKYTKSILRFKEYNVFVLCASAYLPRDLELIGFPIDKCFKWGYFPDKEEILPDKIRENDCLQLLWAGRMIDWKHPEAALYLAKKLKNKLNFHLTMAGDGEMFEWLKQKAKSYGIVNNVTFLGSLSPEDIRGVMKNTDVFLATSDKGEGWGAVVNEAMSCGCVVVASDEMGSVPFLINESNGMQFCSKNWDDMQRKVESLVQNPEVMKKMRENAFASIKNIWNAENAAEQFCQLVKSYHSGEFEYSVKAGPCSRIK